MTLSLTNQNPERSLIDPPLHTKSATRTLHNPSPVMHASHTSAIKITHIHIPPKPSPHIPVTNSEAHINDTRYH